MCLFFKDTFVTFNENRGGYTVGPPGAQVGMAMGWEGLPHSPPH